MLTPQQFLNTLQRLKNNYSQDLKVRVKPVVGKIAKKHFDESFKNEGFTDRSFSPWEPRRNDTRPWDPILKESGKLRVSNEIRYITDGVQIINKVPYGSYHNDGIGQVKRQFIGQSYEMNQNIKTALRVVMVSSIKRSMA